MIEFDIVPFHKIAPELDFNRHYAEIFGEAPDLDVHTYMSASLAGRVLVVTARENGKIVAYSAYVMGHNLRDKRVLEAENHALYVEKTHRGRLGLELLEKADDFLKNMGVKEILYRNDNPLFGKWLQKRGYKEKCTIWSIRHG